MSRTARFTITARFHDRVTEMVVCGDADVTTAPTLQAMLALALDRQPCHLLLDLSRVGYLDCAAVRLIVRAALALSPGRLTICHATPTARRLLQIFGLAHLIGGEPPDPLATLPAQVTPGRAHAAGGPETGSARVRVPSGGTRP